MYFLIFKTLFKKKGVTASILAIALLVAILTSAESIINHISSEAEALGDLSTIGDKYLILSKNSTFITDSKINTEVVSKLSGSSDIKYIIPQRLTQATISTVSGNQSVKIRRVDDVSNFLKMRRARVNGVTAKNGTEANIGVILARSASVNPGDEVKIVEGNETFWVRVVGVITSHTELDTELIIPTETHNHNKNRNISHIELAIKPDVDREEAIKHITELLPENVRIVKVQLSKDFVQEMYDQTLTYLNLWSIAIYAAVVGASYTVATRLITEASYELSTLRAIGAKKRLIFSLVVTYTVITTFMGYILGASIGVAGPQTASTMFMWLKNVEISPFLETSQAIQTLTLTLISSMIGCLYPAFRSANQVYAEKLV